MNVLKKCILILAMAIGIQIMWIFSNEVMAASGRINVELPRQGETQKGTVNINGWALADDKNAYVQIMLDGVIVGNTSRYSRDDVLKVVNGYGGKAYNPNPGFEFTLDLSNVSAGRHTLAARIVSSSNTILAIQDVQINVEKYNARLALEIPTPGESIKEKLKVNGWALSDDKNDKIEVKFDGKVVGQATRYERDDVLKAFPQYGGKDLNPAPGFDFDIDVSKIAVGNHTITVSILNSNNQVMLSETRTIKVSKQYDTLLNFELPVQNETYKTSLKLNGWLMSEDEKATLEAYVDGQKVEGIFSRYARTDVLLVVKGYGGYIKNPMPGFDFNIDTSKLKDGVHTVKLNVVSRSGEILASQEKTINIRKYESKLNVDIPVANQVGKSKVKVNGWALSENKDDKIKILVDNKEIGQATRYERDDVIKAFPQYGGKNLNPAPGFDYDIDVTTLTEGKHNVTIQLVSDMDEVMQQMIVPITVSRNFDARMNFEIPTNNQAVKTEFTIDGWVLSEDEKATLQLYIDNKLVSDKITRYEREDVFKVIPGYGGKETNPTPGFKDVIDVSSFKDGRHTLTLKLVSRFNKVLAEQSKIINIHKYDARLAIEQPKVNQNVKTTVKVNGWALSEDKDDIIQVQIDGKTVGNATRYERNDIYSVVPGYGGKEKNPLPGYDIDLDLSQIKDGVRKITVNVISGKTQEILVSQSVNINVRKYNGMINIETPTENQTLKGDFDITGWEMSETISTVKLTIDGKDFSNLVKRGERQDVLDAIKNYGGKDVNPTPGFVATIPSNKLTPGTHVIKVQTISALGDIIAEQSRKIYLYTNAWHGIDVSEHNGIIDWEAVKKSEIDFAIIRCGYGKDDSSQDDKLFVRNISECERLGIPYGVYLYSYAADREGARSEAEHVLRLIGNRKPICGIWIDMEDADGYKQKNGIPYSAGVEICDEFCKIMESKGYYTGIYANLDWLTGPLNDPMLEKYNKWVAQWNSVCEYGGTYVMWQYTSSGTVSGIEGNVDMNLWLKNRK